MKRKRILFALWLALACTLVHADATLEPVRLELLRSLGVRHPGYGITDYPGNRAAHIPKAYAMVLMAELARMPGKLTAPALNAGTWLLDNADLNDNGVIGWGVPVAWDAYGDGTVNPAHTEYTISTAIVVKALLDWQAADPSAPKQRIAATVAAALRPYLDPRMRAPSGLFPYSLHPHDRRFDTFNPAAYLAGQMQRWARHAPDAAVRKRAQDAADATVRAHITHRQSDANGGWYWHYSVQEKVPNDLAHAGYIIEGLREYVRAGGRLAGEVDVAALHRHLSAFVDPAHKKIRAWPMFRTDVADRARLYDLGMGLYLAATSREHVAELSAVFASNIADYRGADGRYRKYPIGAQPAGKHPAVVREYECYLLYGIAYHLRRG